MSNTKIPFEVPCGEEQAHFVGLKDTSVGGEQYAICFLCSKLYRFTRNAGGFNFVPLGNINIFRAKDLMSALCARRKEV